MVVCDTYSVAAHQVILVTGKGFQLMTAACEWNTTGGSLRDVVVLVCRSQKEWRLHALSVIIFHKNL